MLGTVILPLQYRTINILNEPTHEREKLMERLALISRGVTYAEHDFLFQMINRLYQSREDVEGFERAQVYRFYRILYLYDVAPLVWKAIHVARSQKSEI